jgi:hypothetical protein
MSIYVDKEQSERKGELEWARTERDMCESALSDRDIEIEHLRALLTRVLAAEGRCPTKLLIEISRALA